MPRIPTPEGFERGHEATYNDFLGHAQTRVKDADEVDLAQKITMVNT